MFRKTVRTVIIGSSAGILVPLALVVGHHLLEGQWHLLTLYEKAMIVLWPSSFFLMALEGATTRADVVRIWSASLGVNALLYAILAAVVAGLIGAFRRD